MGARQVKCKLKQGRGTGDPYNSYQDFVDHWDQFKEQMNQLPANQQAEAKAQFNAISDDFGEEIFSSAESAKLAWSNLNPEEQQPVIDLIFGPNGMGE